MRHLIGLLLAVVASAALFFGGGWGISKFGAVDGGHGLRASALTNLHTLLPLAALIGAGLVIGILLTVRRVSALATGLPGLVLIGWSAFVLLRGRHAMSYVPMSGSHYAAGFSTMLSSGVLLFLGVAMIIPIFMPSRWSRTTAEVEDYAPEEIARTSTMGMVP